MKNKRKDAILEIISNRSVETQEDLIIALKQNGYEVTQSTISRDIKQLGLVKVLGPNGKYRYASGLHTKESSSENTDINRMRENFKHSVISIKYAMNDVVIKCYSGMAQSACVALEVLFSELFIGTLAGEDTVFVITADEFAAKNLTKKLEDILG